MEVCSYHCSDVPDCGSVADTCDRAALFVGLGASGFTPVAHKAIVDGVEGLQGFPLFSITAMSLVYLVGTAIYVAHMPEKYWPGRFNYWVSSSLTLHPQSSRKEIRADKHNLR